MATQERVTGRRQTPLKKPTQERVWDVLESGVPGTAMPPWRSQLNADERHALVEFVRSLYGPPQENSTQ